MPDPKTLAEQLEATATAQEAETARAQERALRSWGHVPDPQMEATAARRLKDPALVGPPDMIEALYQGTKAAAAADPEA